MPVAFYLKKDALAYITGSRIAILFQAAARSMHPNISKEEEQQYSAHSLQVWVCVLLEKAGKLPDYIKKRLRWMGKSFWMFLRDTHVIQDQCVVSAPCPKGHVMRMTWNFTMMT